MEQLMKTRALDVFDVHTARDQLALIFGPQAGRLWVETKYREAEEDERDWQARDFDYPDQTPKIEGVIARQVANHRDVYLPAALFDGSRSRGGAKPVYALSFELDEPPHDTAFLKSLGALVLASGRDGGSHVFVLLAEALEESRANDLAYSLARHLGVHGSVGGKWETNGLLRVVGTMNYKYDPPRKVKVTMQPTKRWIVAELEALIGDVTPAPSTRRVLSNDDAIEPQDVKWAHLPDVVRTAFYDNECGKGTDRSGRVFHLVKVCRERGYSLGQTYTIVSEYAPAIEKCEERRVSIAHEVRQCYGEPDEFDEESFWTSRPELAHLRLFARSRMVSPWAMFGAIAVRVAAVIPTDVTLPPTIGSHVSLNVFTALVGKSGVGKGAADKAAAEAVDFGVDVHVASIGSGEGLVKQYAYRKPNEPIVALRDSVLFLIDEVDTLTALTERGGATLLAELRKAWAGERLGFSNSDPTRSIPLMPHRYRMALLIGVQPENAATLLEDKTGGTPQRFLWMPAEDPDAPDVTPATPAPLVWERRKEVDLEDFSELLLDQPRRPDDLRSLRIPAETVQLIQDTQRAKLRGEDRVELDSHAPLARLKIAAILMWLNNRREEVTLDDWDLAGVVMEVSNRTRADMERELRRAQRAMGISTAKFKGQLTAVTEDARDNTMVKSVRGLVIKHLASCSSGMSSSALRKKLPARKRDYFDEVISGLFADGTVTREAVEHNGTNGYRYALADSGV